MKAFAEYLIKKLVKLPKRQINGGCYIRADVVYDTIKALAEENGKDWIPCSERYPDTDDYILLSFANFSVPLVGRYEEDDGGGAFYVGDEDESCSSQCMFVNAWRPLPEPYEEED